MKDPKNKSLNSIFHLNIGLVHIQKGNWKRGVESFSFAIALQKDYVEAYLKRAECLMNLGRNEEAVKDYEAVFKISSSSKHKKLLEEAKASLNKPLSQLSEREMEFALAKVKKDKGNLLFRKKEYESSLTYYTEAISLNPGCPAYFTNRSACHLMLRRYADGLQDAKEAIKIDSSFVKGFIRFGKCQLALGNVTEAFDAFGKAKELDSTHEAVADGLAKSHRLKNGLVEGEEAMEKNQFGKALKLFESASKIACGCGEILLKRSLCLISLHRVEEVSHLIESMPIDLKENPDVLLMKGMLFYHQDCKEEALEHLHNALKCDSPNTKARELVEQIHGVYENLENGESALRRLDTTEALRMFRKGLEIDPRNRCLQAKFHLKIGMALMDQNKLSDAVISFSNAIDMRKDNAEALKLRGQCYQKQKEHKMAVADFQKLLKIIPCEAYRKLLNDAQHEATKVETLPKDYYRILGVPRDATMESIRKSYKALALQLHPDRMSSASEKSRGEEKFKEISEAYTVLIDPLKRERYDRGKYENAPMAF